MIARDQGSAPIGKLEATVDPGIIEDILMTATAYIISGVVPPLALLELVIRKVI